MKKFIVFQGSATNHRQVPCGSPPQVRTYTDGKIGWVTHSGTLTETKAKVEALFRDLS